MACEFSTAVCSRELAARLGLNSIDALRYVSMIYAAIGADAVAGDLMVAGGEFGHAARPRDRHKWNAPLFWSSAAQSRKEAHTPATQRHASGEAG